MDWAHRDLNTREKFLFMDFARKAYGGENKKGNLKKGNGVEKVSLSLLLF
jgi:hypothetical protein